MKIKNDFLRLCKPAQVYVLISAVALFAMILQNLYEPRKYCIGMYSCKLKYNKSILFFMKVLYILFWTIVLDSLCKNGYSSLSWAIVLLPFITLFLLIGMVFLSNL